MKRRSVVLATLGAMVVSMGLAVAPVWAVPPTELDVSPVSQYPDGCPTVVANWQVYVYGGGSGSYTVLVYYGDGSSKQRGFSSAGHYDWGNHTFWVTYNCNSYDFGQSWSAWRASGGGTAYKSTWVYAN